MIDHEYLSKILPLLKANGVQSIDLHGLKIVFHAEQSNQQTLEPLNTESIDSVEQVASAIRKQEESLPPDLRADNLMNFDNIMNWSSPDRQADEPEMPLTGEAPL